MENRAVQIGDAFFDFLSVPAGDAQFFIGKERQRFVKFKADGVVFRQGEIFHTAEKQVFRFVDFSGGEAKVVSISCDGHLKELGVIAAPPWNKNNEKEK